MLRANVNRAAFKQEFKTFKGHARNFNAEFPKTDNNHFLHRISSLIIEDSVEWIDPVITNPFLSSLAQGLLPEPLQCDPQTQSIAYCRTIYALNALASKNPTLLSDFNPLEAAIKKYIECERVCKISNIKLLSRRPCSEWDFPFSFSEFLFRAGEFAAEVLGQAPLLSDVIAHLKFGPGANTTTTRHTSVRHKLSAEPGCGHEMIPLLRKYQAEYQRWLFNATIPVTPARLTFVPKNSKTHRPIEVQPLLSGCYQLSLGEKIRSRLNMFGVDLSDQSINQERARLGSLTDQISTIDLSSASDTVCSALVFQLIPEDWLDLLSYGRVSQVEYHDKLITLNKWSAMGNGYTFELESLIFFVISKTICKLLNLPDDITVYGDDITCDSTSARAVIKALVAVGFSVNTEKTFITGRFKESCGKDYILGCNVRPCYVKKPITYQVLTNMHNFYSENGCFPRLVSWLRDYLSDLVPAGLPQYGDGCLHTDDPLIVRHKNWLTMGMCFISKTSLDKKELFNDILWVLYHGADKIRQDFLDAAETASLNHWTQKWAPDGIEKRIGFDVRGFKNPYKLIRVLNP